MRKSRDETLTIKRWEAETIQNALRELNNYLHFDKAETCNHRNLTASMNTIQNVLNGKSNTEAYNRFKIDTEYTKEIN